MIEIGFILFWELQTVSKNNIIDTKGLMDFDTINDLQPDNQRFSQSFSKENKKQLLQIYDHASQQMISSVKEALYQANQILPAHKTISNQKQKVSFKLSSLTFYKQSLTERLNRSSFPMISQKSKQISQKSKQTQPLFKLKQQMGQFSVFLNDKKILIYQRIKNQMVNYLSKNDKAKSSLSKNQMKYYCSLFVNPKLQKNKSFQKPVWQHVNQIYDLGPPKTTTDLLKFQSSFQSGNLFAVFKDTSNTLPTYELYLQNDINTKGSTQWFYFKVSSKARLKVKFKIMNFYKPTSLYQQGMKVLVKVQGQQSKRVGTAIKYAKNPIQSLKDSYFLQFLYEFESTTKTVYFSYCYTYNYTIDFLPYIESLESKYYKKKIIKRQTLCKTNMGNDLLMLTISNNLLVPVKNTIKPIIYIIGRQHSGQTPGSFVLEGIINFLVSSRFQANELRQKFQFRIIPMVNIDGVISGNYRTNISGNDVNRQWLFPSKLLHPQIYHIKQEIVSNKKNTIFFLDVHAHSRKMNSFFYGCNDFTKQNKLYPFVCSKLNKFISYGDSSFCDDPTKQSTARVTIQKQLNLANSLTFQISFYGWVDPIKKTKHHFKPADLEDIGISLALGFYYSQISLKKIEKQKSQVESLLKSNKATQKQKLVYKNTMKIYEKWKTQLEKQLKLQSDDISEGSSIDPEHFTLQKQEILNIQQQNQKLNVNAEAKENEKKGPKNRDLNFLQTSFNKNQPIKSSRRYQKLISHRLHHKKSKLSDYTMDIEKQQQAEKNSKSNLFSNSINEFFLNSSKNFTVKQLEEQLQGKGRRYLSLSQPQSLLKNQKRTFDFKQTLRYHDKIRQIKNTFNYYLKQSKKDPTDNFQNKTIYKNLIPSLDEDNQVRRNFSLNSKSIKSENSYLKTKRGLSFNSKRGNSFVRYKNQSDFKLQKV